MCCKQTGTNIPTGRFSYKLTHAHAYCVCVGYAQQKLEPWLSQRHKSLELCANTNMYVWVWVRVLHVCMLVYIFVINVFNTNILWLKLTKMTRPLRCVLTDWLICSHRNINKAEVYTGFKFGILEQKYWNLE